MARSAPAAGRQTLLSALAAADGPTATACASAAGANGPATSGAAPTGSTGNRGGDSGRDRHGGPLFGGTLCPVDTADRPGRLACLAAHLADASHGHRRRFG